VGWGDEEGEEKGEKEKGGFHGGGSVEGQSCAGKSVFNCAGDARLVMTIA